MDGDRPDDDLAPWAVPLDEPDPVPTAVAPPAVTPPPAADSPRLSLLSREVPPRDFQPRLWADR